MSVDVDSYERPLSFASRFSHGSALTASSVKSFTHKFNALEARLRTAPPCSQIHSECQDQLKKSNVKQFIDYKIERERRHFPTVSNVRNGTTEKPRGRLYIPHGNGDDYVFVPHPVHIHPTYTECGPDWKSRVRNVCPSHGPDYPAEEIWPNYWKSVRTFPGMTRRTDREWTLYPEADQETVTRRCNFDGVHRATERSKTEITDTEIFGRSKTVLDKRNGIPSASAGDKNYQAVEYSPGFHSIGSTLPLVNFAQSFKMRPDTFVPLQKIPFDRSQSYWWKQISHSHQKEVSDVKSLDDWRPASPLLPPVTASTQQPTIPETDEQGSSTVSSPVNRRRSVAKKFGDLH